MAQRDSHCPSTHLAGTVEAGAQSSQGLEEGGVFVAFDCIEWLNGWQSGLPLTVEVQQAAQVHHVERVLLVLKSRGRDNRSGHGGKCA